MKVKKPRRWSFDRNRVDSKWDWFWDSAVSVVPFWDLEATNINVAGNEVIAPYDLVLKERWTHVTSTANYPEYYLDQNGAHGVVYESTMFWVSPKPEDEILSSGSRATALIVQQKEDAVNRASSGFGVQSGGTAAVRFQAHMPWNDGTVYFDYGGSTGSKRISVSGLSHSGIQAWAFTGGPSGLAFYQDGIKRASNTTAASRTQATVNGIRISAGEAGSDWVSAYFAAFLDHELTDAQARMWAEDPYGPIRDSGPRVIAGDKPGIAGAKLRNRWVGLNRRS